jgi:hypothetical protein
MLWLASLSRLYHIVIAVWRTKEAQSVRVKYWEIIADNLSKAGWNWAASQPWTATGERSSWLTHIAAMVNASLYALMKS